METVGNVVNKIRGFFSTPVVEIGNTVGGSRIVAVQNDYTLKEDSRELDLDFCTRQAVRVQVNHMLSFADFLKEHATTKSKIFISPFGIRCYLDFSQEAERGKCLETCSMYLGRTEIYSRVIDLCGARPVQPSRVADVLLTCRRFTPTISADDVIALSRVRLSKETTVINDALEKGIQVSVKATKAGGAENVTLPTEVVIKIPAYRGVPVKMEISLRLDYIDSDAGPLIRVRRDHIDFELDNFFWDFKDCLEKAMDAQGGVKLPIYIVKTLDQEHGGPMCRGHREPEE